MLQQESAIWSGGAEPSLTTWGQPLVWLLVALGLVLALSEPLRARRELSLARRGAARLGLAFTALSVLVITLALLWKASGSRLPPGDTWAAYLLAAMTLGLAHHRGDRMLRDAPHRGYTGALTLAAAALAAGITAALARFASTLRSAAEAPQLGVDVARRVLAEVSFETLEAARNATIAVALPLCLVCALAALGDPRGERAGLGTAGRRSFLALVALAAGSHLFTSAALASPDFVRLLALAPLALLAWLTLRDHAPSRTTRLCVLAALVVTNAACVLLHASRWLDRAAMDESLARTAEVAAHLSALRWAELRAVFDLLVCGALLTRLARKEREATGERRGRLAASMAWALTGTYAAGLVFALDAPVSALGRALAACAPSSRACRSSTSIPTHRSKPPTGSRRTAASRTPIRARSSLRCVRSRRRRPNERRSGPSQPTAP